MMQIDPGANLKSLSLKAVLESKRTDQRSGKEQIPMASGIQPLDKNAPIIERSKIYIAAPTESDIRSLAPDLELNSFRAINAELGESVIFPDSSQSYLQMGGSTPILCKGDIVINGTLFIKDAIIDTNDEGCRLYVTGSVFIQGTIDFTNQLSKEHLQITSAKAILMGMDVGTLQTRLFSYPEQFQTRNHDVPVDFHNSILTEAIPISGLIGATNLQSPSTYVSYQRLQLNAPEVHSRYAGDFHGVIISEIALFRFGSFTFSFDPALDQVKAFPLLKVDLLSVQE
jgi:hypothetical protein